MFDSSFRLGYRECLDLLWRRLSERAPSRIQLLTGPRQVGKTTLLLEIAQRLGDAALYFAADGPEASLPGARERAWVRAAEKASSSRPSVLLIDEVHLLHDWAAYLKGEWDHIVRRKSPVHVVATGSSALRVGKGSRESLAGRFERLTLTHWSAASIRNVFGAGAAEAADAVVRWGSYPGAWHLRGDRARWAAYVRDAIVEPAIGRDILALASVRRPALLRQVFGICVSSPAQVVSMQKLQGQLHDRGALETIAHYLGLLEEAYLIAAVPKYAASPRRMRSSPPKIIVLNNALLAASDPRGVPEPSTDPARFGAWVENACLAFAWNAGQQVSYWREEPYEVDGITEGSWGRWAIEVKTGRYDAASLRGLLEFTRRHPKFTPLIVCAKEGLANADRMGVGAIEWREFLLSGPPTGRT
ncbi:MAG: ATP-binding protein [candidate division NC10 bacterium]|nr:ATP-binding protein [candidate division NC10 bacterium]